MKTRIIALAALAAITLSGCGTAGGNEDTTETNPTCVKSGELDYGRPLQTCTIELPDTRLVTCLIFNGYNAGGLDCDWTHVSGADRSMNDVH